MPLSMPLSLFLTIVAVDVLWALFALVWVALAFNNKKTLYRQPLRQRLLYLAPGIVALLCVRYAGRLNLPLFRSPLNEIPGVALTALGIAFAVHARLHLGKNWSGFVTLKKEHTLITSGPYRFVRHPIYTGLLAGIFGTLLAIIPSPSALLMFLLTAALLLHKLRLEEKLMRDTFPAQYPAYQQQVKALIPFVL